MTPWILTPTSAVGGPWAWWPPGTALALAWLHAHRLVGSRFALGALDRPETVALLVAAPMAGAVPVLLNRRLDQGTLRRQSTAAGCTVLVGHRDHPLGPELLIPETWPDARTPDPLNPEPEQIVAGMSTSGTTGNPKPVWLRWRQIRHGAEASVAMLALTPRDRWCACLPLDHIGGVMAVWRGAVAGYTLHLHPRFDAETVASDLGSCSGASLVPTQLQRLLTLGRTWDPVRTVLVGGAALDADLERRARAAGLGIRQTYALSECAGTVAIQAADGSPGGQPLPGVRVDLDDGCLRIHGPTTPDGVTWKTRDLGTLAPDHRLTVGGRADEAINSGGEKIQPEPIEAILCQHPGIRDACVCGVDDREWGQRVVVWLVATEDQVPDVALLGWMAARLPGILRPKAWRWTDAIPVTALGKRSRLELGRAFSQPCPEA